MPDLPAALEYADTPARRGIAYAASPGRLSVLIRVPRSTRTVALLSLCLLAASASTVQAVRMAFAPGGPGDVAGLVFPVAFVAFFVWMLVRNRRNRSVTLELDADTLKIAARLDGDEYTASLPRHTVAHAYTNYKSADDSDGHWDLYLRLTDGGLTVARTQLPEPDARWLVRQLNLALGQPPRP